MPVCRRYSMLLAISWALWISTAQAFFCFSRENEVQRWENHYYPPPPIGAYVYGDLPVPSYYARPVMPQRFVAPVEFREADYPDLDPPIAPIELPNDDYPLPDRPVPIQHIFH
jgi:hypothetical protein